MPLTFSPPTPAQRLLLLSYGLAAVAGVPLGLAALHGIEAYEGIVGIAWSESILWIASATGAMCALAAMRGYFGHPGGRGLLQGGLGAIGATAVLGICAGTLILPIYGTMFGPWLVLVAILSKPLVAVPWALALLAFHKARALYHHERDSIFRWESQQPFT